MVRPLLFVCATVALTTVATVSQVSAVPLGHARYQEHWLPFAS